MVVKSATLFVQPEHLDEFIAATRINQAASIQEPGITCFDFFKSQDELGRFLLYEVYKTHDDLIAHTQTAHYKIWLDTVKPWFAKPVDRAVYLPVE